MKLANISFDTKLFKQISAESNGETRITVDSATQNEINWTVALDDFKQKHLVRKLKRGVYIGTLNFDRFIDSFCKTHIVDKNFFNNRYDLDFGRFGVCDNVEQAMQYGRTLFKGIDHEYVLRLWPVLKDEQPSDGGWRWRKWGEYIGTQSPTTEYIRDEPIIEMVFCFKFEPVIPRNSGSYLSHDYGNILSVVIP